MPRTTPKQHNKRRRQRRAAGFTLVEILISLGIFLIGMTAIVSLFPAAAILQRETTQEVLGGMAAESGKAIIDANSLTYGPAAAPTGDLRFYHDNAGLNETDAIPLRFAMTAANFDQQFPYADRSFPSGLVDGTFLTNADVTDDFRSIDNCDLHWVPFIQDISGDRTGTQNWIVRLFIVESDSRANYVGNANDANQNDPNNFPKVRGVNITGFPNNTTFTLAAATDLEASDIVMDSNGNDHVVVEVNPAGTQITVLNPIALFPGTPTTLWYTPRAGGNNSPAQRVVTVEINVESP